MEIVPLEASAIDGQTARQLAVLLGRAFTDRRHTERYSAEEQAALCPSAQRVHENPPSPGELMPQSYLDNFPALRNLARPADDRRACEHFLAFADGYAASHVAMFAQHFQFGELQAAAGYIEDVATDPLHLGEGLASEAMRRAETRARELGLDILGLATGIHEFYERLGWATWNGGHTFQVPDFGLSYPDEPLMLLPLNERGRQLARNAGQMLSWRLWQFHEHPSQGRVAQ